MRERVRRSPWFGLLACIALGCATASPEAGGDEGAERAPRAAAADASLLGPLAADVRSRGVWLWARASGPGEVGFALVAPERRELGTLTAAAENDFTAALRVEGLEPRTAYRYEVRYAGAVVAGAFSTAPSARDPAAVRIGFGGDLAGQNVCRDAERGFPIFAAIEARQPDLFIGLGDMIYADDLCETTGLYGNAQVPGDFAASAELADLRAHWRYAREDPGLARLLASVPYSAVWDDHEVANDFGAADPRLSAGLRVFREYNPVDAGHPARLHRTLRWGQHLELFVLDTRQHRDSNTAADSPAKSLLGDAQREWLIAGLRSSDATWKIVVSSVPLAIPTGADDGHRDGWSGFEGDTGFESELRTILEAVGARRLGSLLWITTDVHFATVLRHHPVPSRPDVSMLEGVVGPLNAGLFPKRQLDDSLRSEALFFHGPESPDAVDDYAEALRWFNFGELEVEEDGRLTLRVLGVEGEELYAETLASPRPRTQRR